MVPIHSADHSSALRSLDVLATPGAPTTMSFRYL